MDSSEYSYFKELLSQLDDDNEEKVNHANSELNALYMSDKPKCLMFAARAINENPDASSLIILSLSFIKRAATVTRTMSETYIRDCWCCEENTAMKMSVREAVTNAAMNVDQNVRYVAAATLAYIIRIEKDQWNDVFAFILGIANDERGESGRFLVIKIFEELFSIHTFADGWPDEIAGFHEMLQYTIRNDDDSVKEALKCLKQMIEEIPGFFNDEIIGASLEVVEHYVNCTDVDISLQNVLLFSQIIKMNPEVVGRFYDDMVKLAVGLLQQTDVEFLKTACYLWVDLRESKSNISEFICKATMEVVPLLLEAAKVEEEDYDYRGNEGIHNHVGIALHTFLEEDPTNTFGMITEFFTENIDSEDWHCRYAAFLSLFGLCSVKTKNEQIFEFIKANIGQFVLIGTEELPQLADVILGTMALIFKTYPEVLLDKSTDVPVFSIISNSLAAGGNNAKRACEILCAIFKNGPRERVLSMFKEYLGIIQNTLDNMNLDVHDITYPFCAFQYLARIAGTKEIDYVEPLLDVFIGKLGESTNPLLGDSTESAFNLSNGYALSITCLIQILGERIIPKMEQVMGTLFSMFTNINLIDEYYILLEAICKIFRRESDSREEDEKFEVFRPYIEPIMSQLIESIKSGDPRQECSAAKAYGAFFQTAGAAAAPLIGDEFQFMLDNIEPEDEDPMMVIPAMIRGIGQLLIAMGAENSPDDEVYAFTQKLVVIVGFKPDKHNISEKEYANALYSSIMVGLRGIAIATDEEIRLKNREFIKTFRKILRSLFINISSVEKSSIEEIEEFVTLVDYLIHEMKAVINVTLRHPSVNSFIDNAIKQLQKFPDYKGLIKSISELRFDIQFT